MYLLIVLFTPLCTQPKLNSRIALVDTDSEWPSKKVNCIKQRILNRFGHADNTIRTMGLKDFDHIVV